MTNARLMADLERALELLEKVDESQLGFAPDPKVSDDVRKLSGVDAYPTDSHLQNLQARIAAVAKAGDDLEPRDASNYVSNLIVACVKLIPPTDE